MPKLNHRRQYHHFDGTSGQLTVTLTGAQVDACSHAGDCDGDVTDTLPHVTMHASPDDIRAILREYGAWDDDELTDDDDNAKRMLWVAACEISENPGDFA